MESLAMSKLELARHTFFAGNGKVSARESTPGLTWKSASCWTARKTCFSSIIAKNDEQGPMQRRPQPLGCETERLLLPHTVARSGTLTASATATNVQPALATNELHFDSLYESSMQELMLSGSHEEVPVKAAWYCNDSLDDPHLHHKRQPNETASWMDVNDLGLYFETVAEERSQATGSNAQISSLKSIGEATGCYHESLVDLSSAPGAFVPRDSPVRNFFREHMHAGDEVRYVINGSGYLDIRDHTDQWIRIQINKGDIMLIPAGMYHRMIMDDNHSLQVLCLHHGGAQWTPLYRPQEDHPARKAYLQDFERRQYYRSECFSAEGYQSSI